jgi:hypothetical protein
MQLTNTQRLPTWNTSKKTKTSLLVDRTVDYYVPCSLKLKNSIDYPHRLYWRMIDEKFCLLEMAVDWHTGLLILFTVVYHKNSVNEITKSDLVVSDIDTIGIPLFDLSLWPLAELENYNFSKEFRETKERFSLYLRDKSLHIVLFQDIVVHRVGLPGCFSCGFNRNGELCDLVLYNLTENELATISDYMRRNSL